mmetsp:Transcript_15523/g.23120  ORF Transcript_15523/g.23120 Transcript_15523/m.23120 type:complete len:140 (-) Transcript_15523:58-477(-)
MSDLFNNIRFRIAAGQNSIQLSNRQRPPIRDEYLESVDFLYVMSPRGRRLLGTSSRSSEGMKRIKKSAIEELPFITIGDNFSEMINQECMICMSDYEEGNKVRILPCMDKFHLNCIDQWLSKCKNFCPLCRMIVSHDTF